MLIDKYEDELVVSYRNSTSNHNCVIYSMTSERLYLIEILHQTTTIRCVFVERDMLYLIEILHQTTTLYIVASVKVWLYLIEILHQTTTRN